MVLAGNLRGSSGTSQGAFERGLLGTAPRPATREASVDTAGAVVSLPEVAPAPKAGLAQLAAAATVTPMLLLALMALGPFVKDAEAAVVRPLPSWLAKLLRKVPLTWEIFSTWEFAMTVLAVVFVQPRLFKQFLAEEGLLQLSYGERPEQKLLLFGAAGSSEEPRPLVVFIHGGSWSHSRHWMYRLVGRRLAKRGFATAVVGYGQYPTSGVHEMVEDVGAALSWLRSDAGRHGVDASRIFLLGHSSGGHLCALTALTGGGVGLSGIAALSSPMDIADHYAWEQGRGVHDISALHPAHGGEENFASFSPTRLLSQLPEGAASALLPPFFVGHGTDDFTVPPEASERFVDALSGAGGRVESRRWPGLGHFSILAALMGFPGPAEAEAAAQDLEDFMERCLERAGGLGAEGPEADLAKLEVPDEVLAAA